MKKLSIPKRYYPATLAYIASVVLINTLFLWVPLVSIAGTTMTPADITAGSVYIFRDFAQREIKHYVIFAMMIACGLSYFLANSEIAFASFAAFSTAEFLDWGIFTLTKKPLSERLVWSAGVSAPVDSWVFCYCVHSLSLLDFTLMTLAKFIGLWIVWEGWRRQRARREKAEIVVD